MLLSIEYAEPLNGERPRAPPKGAVLGGTFPDKKEMLDFDVLQWNTLALP